MAGLIAGGSSNHLVAKSGPYNDSQIKMDEPDNLGSGWYFCRKEIEENSPSRRDGIDLKKEAYLRKSYCTFLQDLGMRLKVPQVTIASAILFCHRFFLRQSHAKNDRRTIATVCMFLAGKVEETPRPLKDVIIVSYEIMHKKDPSAVQKIKQKEVYEQQKELIILGEKVVLTTLGFDLNVNHPYKPLVEAIKKFKVAQNALAQVAWNFVNDGLRTSLCLQFKPHHIAAGAIFLAAKFLKVKLPSDGDKVWWQEFDVTPRQLEDVSNQMLELYEQNRAVQSSHTEVEGSTGGGVNLPAKSTSIVSENSAINVNNEAYVAPITRVVPAQLNANSNRGKNEDSGSADTRSGVWDHNVDGQGNNKSHQNSDDIPKIDKDKLKAALEKRRKSQNDVSNRSDIIDEDDFIERELENGIQMAMEGEKTKGGEGNDWPEPLSSQHQASYGKRNSESFGHRYEEHMEEGELSSLEERELPSPKLQKNKGIGFSDSERDHKKPRCDIGR
ncbi:uncharacterized protein A4U43_C08F22130 [Asparagus officinalis]|uniref:cyclin-T1-3-like n=1 Tax=Asparagus officinalis TaxID=4686 RepID=UPI00098E7453|nr:cyclin-T1-3-like [Asparagus officinalis]ONK60747.1 uncharacterized protein A4U43_C08F22130 [Asparagus officinalis]